MAPFRFLDRFPCARTCLVIASVSIVLWTPDSSTGQEFDRANERWTTFNDQSTIQRTPPQSLARQDKLPYVLILPGILGEQFWDRNVKSGILESGFVGDVEIYDWTRGPLAMPLNVGGNNQQVEYLADRINRFQQEYPGRPLYLVGHSGGCRMAINILENLSENSSLKTAVEKVLLLSPCMNPDYDLRPAMTCTRRGIVSFYSPLDVAIPLPLTFVHGMTKGKLSASAAMTGFRIPSQLSPTEHAMYRQNLRQHQYQMDMMSRGHVGGHFGWTSPRFVSSHVVPLLR